MITLSNSKHKEFGHGNWWRLFLYLRSLIRCFRPFNLSIIQPVCRSLNQSGGLGLIHIRVQFKILNVHFWKLFVVTKIVYFSYIAFFIFCFDFLIQSKANIARTGD